MTPALPSTAPEAISMLQRRSDSSDEGFGLVELVIAIFLLAIISVALIPALYNGIRYSAEQSTTATATRQLNALIEQARETPSCSSLAAAAVHQNFTDGAGHPFTTSGTTGACPSGSAASLVLVAKGEDGSILAKVNALVYVP